ncbi:MAG: response regulator, partial [Proteobacteria bacterium]|nr:response regulator [Pseudomonadota bacterium]
MEKKIRVLLVDDEDRFCKTTSKLLNKKGFDMASTNTAEKAIKLLKKSPRDVIVLDIKMAGMDGHTALQEIKKTDADIQVIVLTGYGTKYSAMRALIREAFDYLAKPCDVEILASRIQDAYMAKHHGFKIDGKKALNIMTSIEELKTVSAEDTIKKAIEKMMGANEKISAWPMAMEDSLRPLLVIDERNILTGILTKMDVIRAVRPEYVSADGSLTQESSRFSSIFWSGFFSDRVKAISLKKVKDLMC